MQGIRIFTLFNIPVHVSLLYIGLLLYYGYSLGDVRYGIVWGACVTFSLLVHEFGHALVAKRFRLQPQVLLHGLGGLCMHQRAERDRDDALIIAAGPGLEFVLGVLSVMAWWAWPRYSPDTLTPMISYALRSMVWINIFWTAVNLVPLWPLDGGQLFRLGLMQKLRPVMAEKITHYVGIGLSVAAIGVAYTFDATLLVLLGLLGVYLNAKQLRPGAVSGAIRPKNRFAKELIGKAEQALVDEHWHDAARLAYQVKDQDSLSEDTLMKTWRVLAVATYHQGEPKRALRFAERARETGEMLDLRAQCLIAMGRDEEAAALLEDHGRSVGQLPARA